MTCIALQAERKWFYSFWMESAAPAPDPEVLAQEAIAQMNLSAIRIGTYPTSSTTSPESMGFVGYPVWMWAQDPDEHTWGPITGSASAGGHTVTATSHWIITWNGAGQHGTIPLELSASTTLTIGELQVVNVYPSRNPHR